MFGVDLGSSLDWFDHVVNTWDKESPQDQKSKYAKKFAQWLKNLANNFVSSILAQRRFIKFCAKEIVAVHNKWEF